MTDKKSYQAAKNWRQANRERYNLSQRQARVEKREQYAAYHQKWRDGQPKPAKKPKRIWKFSTQKFNNLSVRAHRAGIPFNLTQEYLDEITPDVCPVLGIALQSNGRRGPSDAAASVDRLNPELGYIKGNVIVVSFRANRLRSNSTPEELERIAAFYRHLGL